MTAGIRGLRDASGSPAARGRPWIGAVPACRRRPTASAVSGRGASHGRWAQGVTAGISASGTPRNGRQPDASAAVPRLRSRTRGPAVDRRGAGMPAMADSVGGQRPTGQPRPMGAGSDGGHQRLCDASESPPARGLRGCAAASIRDGWASCKLAWCRQTGTGRQRRCSAPMGRRRCWTTPGGVVGNRAAGRSAREYSWTACRWPPDADRGPEVDPRC